MTHYAVTRERGTAWDSSRPMREQKSWAEHAAFMEALVDDGFVVLGGPLGEARVLLLVEAKTEEDVRTRLAADPWEPMGLLRISGIEPWRILLGDSARA